MDLITAVGLSYLTGAVGYGTALIEKKKKDHEIIEEVFDSNNVTLKNYFGTLRPEYIKSKEYIWGKRLYYQFPYGLSSEEARKLVIILSEAFNKDIDISFDYYVQIDIYNKKMYDVIPYDVSLNSINDYKVPIGINRKREVIYYDFEGGFPHLLIAGISGSGKSSTVHSILTSLLLKNIPPDIYLADLKQGVELNTFKDFEYTKGFATTLEDLDLMVSFVEFEMKERYRIMNETKQKKWQGKPIILLIDEMIDFKIGSGDDKETKVLKAKIKERITNITAKGRAAKVYFVGATQRPDKDIVDGIIKTNIATTLGLKTRNNVQSLIILDNVKSAELPYIPGRGYLQQSDDILLQTFYLSEDEQEKLLSTIPRRLKTKVVTDESTTSFKNRQMDENIIDLTKVRFSSN